MELKIKDYGFAEHLITSKYAAEWAEIYKVLSEMPLHLKASDQAGIQGQAIFDPVGTNAYIKENMTSLDWIPNKAIPSEFDFLGKDIDFVKSGVIVEVQFSNYPFLLNNLLRSELFFKAKTMFSNSATELLVIVTKAHMFPSSNSTLYFEQACNQLNALSNNKVFEIPIRLVGLASPATNPVPCIWTTYNDPRYSRSVALQEEIFVNLSPGVQAKSRMLITR